MKNIKFIVGIIGLFVVMGFSYGAELRILPETRSVGKNCIESFDIYLNLKDGEEALASDIILDSNMEFINFENAGIFESYIPPRNLGKINHFVLLNMGGNNITGGGILGTVYYKVVTDNPYINFEFNGVGNTSDTNLSLEGKDILSSVLGGKYFVDEGMFCNEYTGQYYSEDDFQLAVDNVAAELVSLDGKLDNRVLYCILLSFGLVVMAIILLCVLKKRGKRD